MASDDDDMPPLLPPVVPMAGRPPSEGADDDAPPPPLPGFGAVVQAAPADDGVWAAQMTPTLEFECDDFGVPSKVHHRVTSQAAENLKQGDVPCSAWERP
eukprot:scaffold1282_cov251-Pinguiococcus_pyrenoidosus.AAC.27